MAFFCHQCGTSLPTGARFCSSCGTVVSMAAPLLGRPLMRPLVGRQIAGVCLAIARSNGWDVTPVRILTVVAFLFSSGLVGIAYLAGWIGIPEEPMPIPPMYPGQGVYPPQV